MAGSRTLKLSILADVDDLRKGLNTADKDVSSFGDKITKFGKVAGAAFVAAGVAATAYAGKLAIDGVKAAIEDEAAQLRLATTLKNVTGATQDQIKATEDYILQSTLATGVTDEQLRPSLDRLVRSTSDVKKAQELQTLALDIAAGTGKDLAAVTEALAKTYDGNFGALKRLGVPLDESIIKSKDFDAAQKALADTFAGQSSIQAETFAGKMQRLKAAFDEGKEQVGSYILDGLTPLISGIVNKVIPAVQAFISSIGGEKGIKSALSTYVDFVKSVFGPVLEGLKFAFDKIKSAVEDNKESFKALLDFLKVLAPYFGGALKLAIQGIGIALSVVLNVIADLIDGFRTLINLGSKIGGAIGGMFGGGRAAGGPVSAGTTYLVGEKGPELFTPSGSGRIIPNSAMGGGSNVINITVNGAIDPISTARQITQILNREATLSGTFNKVGASLLVGA